MHLSVCCFLSNNHQILQKKRKVLQNQKRIRQKANIICTKGKLGRVNAFIINNDFKQQRSKSSSRRERSSRHHWDPGIQIFLLHYMLIFILLIPHVCVSPYLLSQLTLLSVYSPAVLITSHIC